MSVTTFIVSIEVVKGNLSVRYEHQQDKVALTVIINTY
jgi:hypothetical protein